MGTRKGDNMKKEEYETLIATATPENYTTVLTDIMDKVRVDCEVYDTMQETNRQLSEKVASLQDSNMKLFLRVNEVVEPEKAQEPEKDDMEEVLQMFGGRF